MFAMDMIDPLYVASGFGVGLLVGLTGVGGGSLMTPLLILLFGIHPTTAVGTDLLYAAATKTGGSLVHGLARSLMAKAIEWCRANGVSTVILHASNEGRVLYESMGFAPTNEMRIVLDLVGTKSG